jgi:hypothetical protein
MPSSMKLFSVPRVPLATKLLGKPVEPRPPTLPFVPASVRVTPTVSVARSR